MEALRQHNKHVTNQINQQITIQRGRKGGRSRESRETDDGPSAADLQAQILMELQQANNLAKNTHQNVKKIAAKPKPATFVTNAELNYLENDLNDRGSAINLNVPAGA